MPQELVHKGQMLRLNLRRRLPLEVCSATCAYRNSEEYRVTGDDMTTTTFVREAHVCASPWHLTSKLCRASHAAA